MNRLLAWLRANPLAGRQILKLAVALPLGGAVGLGLLGACTLFDITPNVAAVGAALATFWGSQRLAPALGRRLGLPEE